MAAPMHWENSGEDRMKETPGNNAFRPRHTMQQNRFNHDFSNTRNFVSNAPTFPQQVNRFNRPNFTPPIQTQHEGFRPNQQGHRFFGNDINKTHENNHGGHHSNMAQGSFMANKEMNMPLRFPMGIDSQVQQNINAMNMGFPNRPPPPASPMFNPSVPPPMPNSFTAPPGGMMQPPGFHQMNRSSFQYQNNPTIPPAKQDNRSLQEDVPFAVLKAQEGQKRDASQKIEDENWVSEWTQKIGKRQEKKVDQTITVCKTQEKTRHMLVLLARLQKGKHDLESMKNEDKSIWEQKLKEVLQIKTELELLHQDLTSEETVTALKHKVDKTRKKRERIKRQKVGSLEKKREELTRREEIHTRMDKDIQQVIEKQRLKKQEEEMKKEADQILGQVRKKISDANKTIQLLNGIEKLRNLRKDRLTNQGILSMYESQGESSTKSLKFEREIKDMVALLNTQLETYKAEEETLKVILETEQEETREKEREKVLHKQQEKQRREKLAENKMLFGNQKNPKPGDPLYPFWQYYCVAENSLDALVSIRREWDMYLTLPNAPGSSCIPSDWVIPPEPSSDVWNTALMNEVP